MTYKELRDSGILEDMLNSHNSWIDSNDVRGLFQEGGVIHAFNASVDASTENRITQITLVY